ncbi:hypothetical protein, partial [Scytonema sp. HK-05]|uniref:hypothetical protein n=1 Tax=Scytonema sp. HK-05 TaxID=1137095 RepID=UPI00095C7F1F
RSTVVVGALSPSRPPIKVAPRAVPPQSPESQAQIQELWTRDVVNSQITTPRPATVMVARTGYSLSFT